MNQRLTVVCDANFLAELSSAGLTDRALSLPIRWAAPDFVVDTELPPLTASALLSRGLVRVDLTPAEVTMTEDLAVANPNLSLGDAMALALVTYRDWDLLTDEVGLRKAALKASLKCRGMEWLLARLADLRPLSPLPEQEAQTTEVDDVPMNAPGQNELQPGPGDLVHAVERVPREGS